VAFCWLVVAVGGGWWRVVAGGGGCVDAADGDGEVRTVSEARAFSFDLAAVGGDDGAGNREP